MSVKVEDFTSQVISMTSQKASIFLRTISDRIVAVSEPRTPKKEGRLRLDILKQTLGMKGKIIWGKKYASIQETKQFKNYTTPGTGPHYAENAVKKVVKETEKVAKISGLI